MSAPDRNLETARLALVRLAIVCPAVFLTVLAHAWFALRTPGFATEIPWFFVTWGACLSLALPLVTVAERALKPLGARRSAALLLVFCLLLIFWAYQSTYLGQLFQGADWRVATEVSLTRLRDRFRTPGSSLYFLIWVLTGALPLLLLCGMRRARSRLWLQVAAPLGLALISDVALRVYDFHRAGIGFQVNLWSFATGVPKGFTCAWYALAAAWTDRRRAVSDCEA